MPRATHINHVTLIVDDLAKAAAFYEQELGLEPLPADDPTQRRPDIALAKEKLGWEPAMPLREGLQKTIEWFKSIDLSTFRPPTPNF